MAAAIGSEVRVKGDVFPFRIRLGIFLLFESAGLSACAVTILLCYVAQRIFKRYWARRTLQNRMRGEWLNSLYFSLRIEEQTDATDSSFFISLMAAELIQAIGGLYNIKWVLDGKVTEGPLCTAQGVFKQYGDVMVAFMSLTIAIQTFCILVIRWYIPRWASKYILMVIFTIVTLLVGVSSGVLSRSSRGPYYADTGYWCWIGDNYKAEKIVFEYLWMWLAASIMLLLYGGIALVIRGILVIGDERSNNKSWKVRWNWRTTDVPNPLQKPRVLVESPQGSEESDGAEERRQAKTVANLMLFYPLVYIICIFPVALARWLAFSGRAIHPAAILATDFVFALSGLLNSILYVVTRPELVKGGTSDSGSDIGRRFAIGAGVAQRQRSRAQSKRSRQATEKRSMPKLHGLGHLPDRSDDDVREQTTHFDSATSTGDDSPWMMRKGSQHRLNARSNSYSFSQTNSHSRSDSGGTYPGGLVGGISPQEARLSHPQSPPPDLRYHPYTGPMPGQFDIRDHHGGVGLHRHGSSGSQHHQHWRPKERRLENFDMGFLPDPEADLERGRDGEEMAGGLSLPGPTQFSSSSRWDHWNWDVKQDSEVLGGLSPGRDASMSVRWSGDMEGIPHAI